MNILNLQDSKQLATQLAYTKVYVVTKNYFYKNMDKKKISHLLIGATIYDVVSTPVSERDENFYEIHLGSSQGFEIHSERVV